MESEFFDLSSYKNSNIRLRFRLTSDGSGNYAGWYIDQIKIYSPPHKTLTVNKSGNGSTTPAGTVNIEPSTPYSIIATPAGGNRFSSWTVESGSASFADPNSASTTVQITNDATIRANFIPGIIYPITTTTTKYNYTTNYYEISPTGGVRFKFIAPSAGGYSITVQNVQRQLFLRYSDNYS